MSKTSSKTICASLRKFTPLILELVRRDLKVKYRRSVLGYFWSLLNPLMMMAIMSFVFSHFFRSSISNFPLYLICGQTLWNCFNESTTRAMWAISDNRELLKKVYIPKFVFPISRVLSCFVIMSLSLIAIVIVMLVTRAAFHWTLLLFWVPLLLLFIFCSGVGLALSALATYFRDIIHLYSVVTLAWMYATPIFYDFSLLHPSVQKLLALNPMYYYITFFRNLVLDGCFPTWDFLLICIGCTLLSFTVGMIIFKKLQRNFILYI